MKRLFFVLMLISVQFTQAHASENILRYATEAGPTTADPYIHFFVTNVNFRHNFYESLVRRNKSYDIEPSLATKWETIEPTRWRFHLRKGVTFHEGEPFTADDVVFSFQRASQKLSGAHTAIISIKDVVKVDNHTVDIHTKSPTATLPDEMLLWQIMSKKWCETHNSVNVDEANSNGSFYTNRHANGTGPFKLIKFDPDNKSVLIKNNAWWDTPLHNLDKVILTPLNNAGTRVMALASGEIDLISELPLQDVENITKNKQLRLTKYANAAVMYFGLNFKKDTLEEMPGIPNPIRNKLVRQALIKAIDADALIKVIFRGHASKISTVIAPCVNGYSTELETRPPYDPEGARQLLKQAGFENKLKLDCRFPNSRYANSTAVCSAIAAMLAKVGVKLNVTPIPMAVYAAQHNNHELTTWLGGFVTATNDAHSALFSFLSTPHSSASAGTLNGGWYSNPKIDALTMKVGSEMNTTKRNQMIKEALMIYKQEIGNIPLYREHSFFAHKKSVSLTTRPEGFLSLRWIRKQS